MKINDQTAINLAKKLNIKLNLKNNNNYYDGIPLKEWKYGIEVELEHGSMYGKDTNVTKDDLLSTAKIALAHFKEFPDYYRGLKDMEENYEKKWKDRKKPCIVNCPGSYNDKTTMKLLNGGLFWKSGGRKYKSEIQSVLIPRKSFKSKEDAKNWIKKHKNFKNNKIDVTKNYYRFIQNNPKKYKKFRTIELGEKGIKAIVGLL